MKLIDHTGRVLHFTDTPKTIISLVPSLTEMICDLGLEENLKGITKFCVHPSGLRHKKTIVGGTKNVRLGVIDSLNPDLIIANKEENDQGQILELIERHKVFVSDIKNTDDSLNILRSMGQLFQQSVKADQLSGDISATLPKLIMPSKRTLYLIWQNPYMSIGGDTYIHHIISMLGLRSVTKAASRYPTLSAQDISRLNPDLVLLSSEPFPFKEKHVEEINKLVPQAKVILVDGEIFSWYGTRILKKKGYFENLKRQIE